jgi:hypothetical protein
VLLKIAEKAAEDGTAATTVGTSAATAQWWSPSAVRMVRSNTHALTATAAQEMAFPWDF